MEAKFVVIFGQNIVLSIWSGLLILYLLMFRYLYSDKFIFAGQAQLAAKQEVSERCVAHAAVARDGKRLPQR